MDGETLSEALLSFLTQRVPALMMEVLTDGCPLCVGASRRACVSKTDIHGDICSSVCPSLSKFLFAEGMVLHHHVKITNKQISYDFYMRNKGLNLDCVCEER